MLRKGDKDIKVRSERASAPPTLPIRKQKLPMSKSGVIERRARELDKVPNFCLQ